MNRLVLSFLCINITLLFIIITRTTTTSLDDNNNAKKNNQKLQDQDQSNRQINTKQEFLKHDNNNNAISKQGGMRREMLNPYNAIESHRVINYGDNHPYHPTNRLLKQKQRKQGKDGYSSNDEIYKPIRIYFETSYMNKLAFTSTDYQKKIDYLKQRILPETKKIWTERLNVMPITDRWNVEYSWCPFGVKEYMDVDVYNNGIEGYDLIIFVTANSKNVCYNNDGSSTGTLASAHSCLWDQYQRPIAGNIDFCLDSIEIGENNAQQESSEEYKKAIGTATHEFGHILGISSNDFLFYYDWSTGLPRTPTPLKETITCVNGSKVTLYVPSTDVLQLGQVQYQKNNKPYYEIVTPTVRSVVQNQFNCTLVRGAKLENIKTYGDCFGSHFDERLYFTELMSSIQTDVTEYLSSLTLGLLYDTGWYKPNFKKAAISPFGLHAGCDFVFEDCIIDKGTIPQYSNGFFCNKEFIPGDPNPIYGCDATHTKMAICDLIDYSYHPSSNNVLMPPLDYQYFDNPLLGSIMQTADYCPTYSAEAISCYNFPHNIYPSIFNNNNNTNTTNNKTTTTIIKEDYSLNAKCINLKHTIRPACFNMICDDNNYNVIIKINDDENDDIICDYDGQTHVLPYAIDDNNNITMYCPRLSVVCPQFTCPINCAGKGKCDFTRKPPKCICYDPDDISPGCTNSIDITPPKKAFITGGDNENSATVAFSTTSIGSIIFCSFILFILIIS